MTTEARDRREDAKELIRMALNYLETEHGITVKGIRFRRTEKTYGQNIIWNVDILVTP